MEQRVRKFPSLIHSAISGLVEVAYPKKYRTSAPTMVGWGPLTTKMQNRSRYKKNELGLDLTL